MSYARGLRAAILAGGAVASPFLLPVSHTVAPPASAPDAYAWGSTGFGECGVGYESVSGLSTPTRIEGLPRGVVAAVSSGSAVSSALLTRDGKVYTFGCGRDARLGHGDIGTANVCLPQLVTALPSGVVQVAMGEFQGAALTAEGEAYVWGKRGVATEHGLPTLAKGLAGARVTQVACGREHTVLVDATGAVFTLGVGTSYALGHGDKVDSKTAKQVHALAGKRVVQAAAGREHTLFLTSEGEVYACGTDAYGQCGQAMTTPYVKTPTLVRGALSSKRVTSIAAGEYHSIALCDDGSVFLWGVNKEGTLGHGDRSDIGTPRLLEARLDGRVTQVAAGGGHTLLLTDRAVLYAVGRGRSGQLGRGGGLESVAAYRTEPVEVPALSRQPRARVVSIAAGRDHSLAVVENLA